MRKKRLLLMAGKILTVIFVIMVVFFMFHGENILLKPLMTGVPIPEGFGDIIVVFGGGMRKDSGVQLGFSTVERLNQAIALYRIRKRPILVSDGSLYRKSPAIPLVVEYLAGKGIEREYIIIDGESQTTSDNVRKTFEIVDNLGLKEIIICTSPYHQRRSQKLLEKGTSAHFLIAVSSESEVFTAKTIGQRLRNMNLIFHEYAALISISIHDLF